MGTPVIMLMTVEPPQPAIDPPQPPMPSPEGPGPAQQPEIDPIETPDIPPYPGQGA
jgi:hypothetical protein